MEVKSNFSKGAYEDKKRDFNKSIFFCKIISVILFFYALDFLGSANYIVLLLTLTGILFLAYKKFRVSLENLILLFFCLTYSCIYIINIGFSQQAVIRYMIAPWLLYCVFGNAIYGEKEAIHGILIIVWGLFIYGGANMLLSLANNYSRGYLDNIWGGQITSTLQGILLTPMSGLFFFGCIQKGIKRIGYLLAAAACVYFTILTGRRTLIITCLIVLFVNVILYVFEKKCWKRFFKVSSIFILIVITGVICYINDVAGIKRAFESSYLYERIFVTGDKLSDSGRFQYYRYMLNNISEYFFGYSGGGGQEFTYAHNLILDILRVSGIIPAVLMLIYVISTAKKVFQIIRIKSISSYFKYIYISTYLSMLIPFMVEPVLEGAPHVFIMFCIINSMAEKILYSCKRSAVYYR